MSKYLRGISISIVFVITLLSFVSISNSRFISSVKAESINPRRIDKEKDKNSELKTEIKEQSNIPIQQSNLNLSNILKNGGKIKPTVWSAIGWNYHKQLSLINSGTNLVRSTSTVTISVDTSALESVLANCNDIRVIYQGVTELPIKVIKELGSTNCTDSKTTRIVFPLQTNLAGGTENTKDYQLYYGNNLAGAPDSTDGFSIQGGPVATMICSFNGTTTCETGQTPTAANGAIRFSGQKSAMIFDGKNDRVTAQVGVLPTTFTIETWAKSSTLNGGYIWGFEGSQASHIRMSLNGLQIDNHHNATQSYNVNYSFTKDTWYHISVSMTQGIGSSIKVYVNGQLQSGSWAYGSNGNGGLWGGTGLILGGGSMGGDSYTDVTLDEYRISDVERYSSNFTPLLSSFVTDSHTKLLYHFDENGDDPRYTGKIIDASGNGINATINGSKYVSGLVGIDNNTTTTGNLSSQSFASHSGVFIEEGTTNLITNPSFENATYDLNWSVNNLTKTKNTTSPQFKFGSNSTKLVAAGVNGEFTTNIQVPTLESTLSTYLYDGTNGNIGGVIDSNIAEIYSSGGAVTTSYKDEGGGWWRLSSKSNFASRNYYDNTNTDSDQGLLSDNQNKKLSQKIVANATGVVTYVDVNIKNVGSNQKALNIQIQTDDAGSPSGTPVTNGTSICYWGVWIGSTYGTIRFSFTNYPSLTSGTTYHIVATPYTNGSCSVVDTIPDSSKYISWGYDNSASSFATGDKEVFNGTTWTTETGKDHSFSMYIGSNIDLGLRVKTGKTVYVDGVQLEQKLFATSYTDGSLGTGYGWDTDCLGIISDNLGTSNNSCSIRYSGSNAGIAYNNARGNSIVYSPSSINKDLYTVSMWIKPNIDYRQSTADYGWSRNHCFWELGNTWNNVDGLCINASYYGSVYLYTYFEGTNRPNGITYVISTDWTNKWNHIVWAYDINGSHSLYVNNELVGTQSNTGKVAMANPIAMSVGGLYQELATNHGHGGSLDGVLSDFRIYNQALNSNQVSDLFNQGLLEHKYDGIQDNSLPSVTIIPLFKNQSLTSPTNITGVATDTESKVSLVEYQIDGTGGTWSTCSPTDGTWNSVSEQYTCSVNGLSAGTHTIYARAYDNQNNISNNASYTFTVIEGIKVVKVDNRASDGLGLSISNTGFSKLTYLTNDTDPYKVIHADCSDKNCESTTVTEVKNDSYWSEPGSYISSIGPDGFSRIVYQNKPDNILKYIRCEDKDCVNNTVTTVDSNSANSPGDYGQQILNGPDNLPRILYSNCGDDSNMHFVRFTAEDTPSINTNLTLLGVNPECWPYASSSMIIGTDNLVRMVFFDSLDYNPKLARCTNEDCTNVVITALENTGYSGAYYGSVIRIGSDGFPRIAYYDRYNNRVMHYVKCLDQDCNSKQSQDLPSYLGTNAYNGIGMDLRYGNLASITYTASNNSLYLINCTNETCSTYDNILVDSHGIAGGASLQVGKDNLIRILYSDASTGTYFAKFLDNQFPILTLTSFNSNILTTTLTLTGTVSDDIGLMKNVEFQIDNTNGSWTSCVSNDGTFNEPSEDFTCSLSGIIDGTHRIYLRGTDSSDNVPTESDITSVDISKGSLDIVAPGKVIITNLGSISSIPNKDKLKYFFTSETPTIKGNSEANSSVYFNVNGHTYNTVTGSDGKFAILLSNPSLLRIANTIVYYAKDGSLNKSEERTLILTVGEENFPIKSSSSSSSESSITSSSSSSTLTSSSSSSSLSNSTSSKNVEVLETTKEISIKGENGNVLINTKVTINGKTYVTDSMGKVKAEVAGVYIVEYEKDGMKYSSTINSVDSNVTLKTFNQSSLILPILIAIVFLILGAPIFIIVLKKIS